MKSSSLLIRLFLSTLIVVFLVAAYFVYRGRSTPLGRSARVLAWLNNSQAHPEWKMRAGERCEGAPFVFPTDGFVGYLWGDSFRLGHHHQGIDIFGGGALGEIPVVAAYPGYLTRLPEWKSSLIVRLPQDPLQPQRQIWVYYTHMADPEGISYISPEFPAGISEVYVEAGTLLGYQGNYSGDPFNPTGIHLHFSIVLDDGGQFRNELEFNNTLDPSQYLGLPLNAAKNQDEIPLCSTISEVTDE